MANGFQSKKEVAGDFCRAMFSLRAVKAEDRDFLVELNESVMRPYYEVCAAWDSCKAQSFMQDMLLPGKDQIIMVNGERAGLLAVDRSDDRFHLRFLQIAENFQRQGIGAALVRGLLQEAGKNSLPVTLDVLKNNPVQSLYERLGFSIVGISENKLHMKAEPGCERAVQAS